MEGEREFGSGLEDLDVSSPHIILDMQWNPDQNPNRQADPKICEETQRPRIIKS